jgi:DNA modification methylase
LDEIKKIMLNKQINLLLGDCLELLKKIPSNTVDLAFVDPPYNMQLDSTLYRPDRTKVNGVQDAKWDKFSSFALYDEFCISWLKEVYRILKPSGSIWLIGSYHNIFRLGKILQDLDFWILNDIIWHKTNPMPNFKGLRFTNAHETLIWATKTKETKYCFNYHSMKILNDDKQMNSIWNIPICAGIERLKINNQTAHPTQKPQELLIRILLATTQEHHVVLDPFMGTGTTGAVAKMLNRHFIGIELDPAYFQLAQDRINQTEVLENLQYKHFVITKRISLGNLIEANLLNKNDVLYDHIKKNQAIINLDGSLQLQNSDIKGSIHQVATKIMNKNVNGWDYWFIIKNQQMISINDLRKKYYHDFCEDSP